MGRRGYKQRRPTNTYYCQVCKRTFNKSELQGANPNILNILGVCLCGTMIRG